MISYSPPSTVPGSIPVISTPSSSGSTTITCPQGYMLYSPSSSSAEGMVCVPLPTEASTRTHTPGNKPMTSTDPYCGGGSCACQDGYVLTSGVIGSGFMCVPRITEVSSGVFACAFSDESPVQDPDGFMICASPWAVAKEKSDPTPAPTPTPDPTPAPDPTCTPDGTALDINMFTPACTQRASASKPRTYSLTTKALNCCSGRISITCEDIRNVMTNVVCGDVPAVGPPSSACLPPGTALDTSLYGGGCGSLSANTNPRAYYTVASTNQATECCSGSVKTTCADTGNVAISAVCGEMPAP